METAKSSIGVESIHGGNNRSCIDCSHLVYQIYKQVGAKSIVLQTVPNMKKNVYYVKLKFPYSWRRNFLGKGCHQGREKIFAFCSCRNIHRKWEIYA